jgi:hypothetical protein
MDSHKTGYLRDLAWFVQTTEASMQAQTPMLARSRAQAIAAVELQPTQLLELITARAARLVQQAMCARQCVLVATNRLECQTVSSWCAMLTEISKRVQIVATSAAQPMTAVEL